MRETVAIIGGGVAGLTAAHELIERGFEVSVFERRSTFGGKAASSRLAARPDDVTERGSRAPHATSRHGAEDGAPADGLPTEHGFRFFPGWYRHLTDTMERIPYRRAGGGRQTVAANLVTIRENLLAWFDRPPFILPLSIPSKAGDLAAFSRSLGEFSGLGLSSSEIALFFKKLLELCAMTDERRAERLENVTWWDFLECSSPERSRAYRDLARATTRTMVAAKVEEVSAYTIGRLAIRTLLDTASNLDRVLNGPTNEVWIDPWIAYLKSRGVKFFTGIELKAIEIDRDRQRIERLVVESVEVVNARRLRRLLLRQVAGKAPPTEDSIKEAADLAHDLPASIWTSADTDDKGLAAPGELLAALAAARAALAEEEALQGGAGVASPASVAAQDRLAASEKHCQDLAERLTRFELSDKHLRHVKASSFVLALPLEQLAYYVNRSTMLTHLAPELRNVLRLSRHMDWMAGIQFYLREPFDLSPGHIVGLDSTWALTAIEQTQFWRDVRLPGQVKGVLSVDIAAWDKKGRITRKEAYNCSDDEIAREVWGQLKEMLNKGDRVDVLRDDMLVGGLLSKNVSFRFDDSIVDLRDRKKQAFYERARSLKFNTVAGLGDDPADEADPSTVSSDELYAWGPRRRFNTEPLLVNRAGSRALRPEACTGIPNLYLAADYVKTETDLACMEGANEAARLAVNGILDATASREPRCTLWPFSPTRQAIEALGSTAAPLRAARAAATAVSQLQNRFWKGLATNLMRIRDGSAEPPGPGTTTHFSR